jgi:hypothetical protein
MKRIAYEIDLRARLAWALHNGVAHPLMVVLPRSLGNAVHDATGALAERLDGSRREARR